MNCIMVPCVDLHIVKVQCLDCFCSLLSANGAGVGLFAFDCNCCFLGDLTVVPGVLKSSNFSGFNFTAGAGAGFYSLFAAACFLSDLPVTEAVLDADKVYFICLCIGECRAVSITVDSDGAACKCVLAYVAYFPADFNVFKCSAVFECVGFYSRNTLAEGYALKCEQPKNVPTVMEVSLSLNTTVLSPLQSQNTRLPIFSTFSPSVTEVRFSHFSNA